MLGAVSVATAIATEGAIGNEQAKIPSGQVKMLEIEHPSGKMEVIVTFQKDTPSRTEELRTARKLMDGTVYY